MLFGTHNPYLPPQVQVLEPEEQTSAPPQLEALRRKYLHYEAAIRSISTLYWLLALAFIGVGLSSLVAYLMGEANYHLLAALVLLPMSVGLIHLARRLARIDVRAKLPTIVVSIFLLLSFPFGTLLNSYVLYLLLGPPGKMVFSARYRQAVLYTPHLRYHTPWYLLAALSAVVGALLVALGVTWQRVS